MATATPPTTTTAAVYDTARLSVGDLFNAQAAHATYQRLVDVINAQAASIETLLRRVATLESTQRHAVAAQQHALQQMDAAVDQLERMQRQQTKMGQTQRLHGVKIDELAETATASRARTEAIEDRMERLDQRLSHSVEVLRADKAPMELVLRLQDDQFALHERMAVVDTRIATKLDKSELARLDGVVAKIQAFAPTAGQLTSRVDRLEEQSLDTDETLAKMKKRVAEADERAQDIHKTLQTKMEEAKWLEFCDATFKDAVDALQRQSNATDRTVRELVHRGVALETSNRTLSSKLASITASIVDELQSHRSETEHALETKLDRGMVDAALKEIRHELSCKAWRKDNAEVTSGLEEVKRKMEAMEYQVALTTRFLDWFMQRGDAYERNLDVVEHQLERLAHASAPQLRQPYGDEVRYPRE